MLHWRLPGSWLVAAILLVAAVVGCAVNPVTGRHELTLVSEQEEIAIGRKNYQPGQQQSGGQYILDQALTAYVQGIGAKLAAVSDRPQLPYEFVVLNESVPNAWAMPGGKIAINRGLLIELENEAELAAVMAHEIVHAAGRHGARGMENNLLVGLGATVVAAAVSNDRNSRIVDTVAGIGAGLLGMKYGRDLELEADHYGMRYMQRAGYDPVAAVTLQEKFLKLANSKQPNWLAGLFASHPPSQERVEANRKAAQAMPGRYVLGREDYQTKVATLMRTRDAYKRFDEGEKALAKGEADKALGLAEEAIKGEPREALFYGLRGEAKSKLGRHAEAEADYGEAIARNPEFYEFYLGRGKERRRRGDSTGALADFTQANRLLPTAQAHLAAGQLRLQGGQRDEAAKHFEAAASARSEEGRQAGNALARLTLPDNPSRFLTAGIERQGNQLLVVVSNRAGVAAGRVVVDVANSARGSVRVALPRVDAGGTGRALLPWTVIDVPQGARVEARVVAASVAD